MAITQEIRKLIVDLKSKYSRIFLLDLNKFRLSNRKLDSYAIIKPMTRAEFYFSQSNYLVDPISTVNLVIKKNCVFTNTDFNELKAGIDQYVYLAIQKISSFNKVEDLVTNVLKYKNEALTLEYKMTSHICRAFPSITPKDVDNMTADEIFKHACLAEVVLKEEIDYNEFLNPKKSKHKQQQEPPIPKGFYSAGGKKKETYVEESEHVVVTKDNLKTIINRDGAKL